MKLLMITMLMAAHSVAWAQKIVTESVALTNQTELVTDFPFADNISIKTWAQNEVKVVANVSINDGADDHIFVLEKEVTSDRVTIKMSMSEWEKASKGNYCMKSTIHYEIFLPAAITLSSKTINGSYLVDDYRRPMSLVTISGDIDVTFGGGANADLRMKTLTGEVYTDLQIDLANSKPGMKRIMGMNAQGKLGEGGSLIKMETISGSIYLRKG